MSLLKSGKWKAGRSGFTTGRGNSYRIFKVGDVPPALDEVEKVTRVIADAVNFCLAVGVNYVDLPRTWPNCSNCGEDELYCFLITRQHQHGKECELRCYACGKEADVAVLEQANR